MKIMPDEKGGTKLLMEPLDGGIAEIDVGIKNVCVISLQPRHIGGVNCTVYARNDEREPSAPPAERFCEDGVEQQPLGQGPCRTRVRHIPARRRGCRAA